MFKKRVIPTEFSAASHHRFDKEKDVSDEDLEISVLEFDNSNVGFTTFAAGLDNFAVSPNISNVANVEVRVVDEVVEEVVEEVVDEVVEEVVVVEVVDEVVDVVEVVVTRNSVVLKTLKVIVKNQFLSL